MIKIFRELKKIVVVMEILIFFRFFMYFGFEMILFIY